MLRSFLPFTSSVTTRKVSSCLLLQTTRFCSSSSAAAAAAVVPSETTNINIINDQQQPKSTSTEIENEQEEEKFPPITIEPSEITRPQYFTSSKLLRLSDLVSHSTQNGQSDEEAAAAAEKLLSKDNNKKDQKSNKKSLNDLRLEKLVDKFRTGVSEYLSTQSSSINALLDEKKNNNTTTTTYLRPIDRIIQKKKEKLQQLQDENTNNTNYTTIIPPLSLLGDGQSQNILHSITDPASGGFHILNGELVVDQDTNSFLSSQLRKMKIDNNNAKNNNNPMTMMMKPCWFFSPDSSYQYSKSNNNGSSYYSQQHRGYSSPSSSNNTFFIQQAERRLFTPKTYKDEINILTVPFHTRLLHHAPLVESTNNNNNLESPSDDVTSDDLAASSSSATETAEELLKSDTLTFGKEGKVDTKILEKTLKKKLHRQGSNKIVSQKFPMLLNDAQVKLDTLLVTTKSNNNNKEETDELTTTTEEEKLEQQNQFEALYKHLESKYTETLSILNQFAEEWKMIADFVKSDQKLVNNNNNSTNETENNNNDHQQQTGYTAFYSNKHHIKSFLKGNLSPSLCQHHVLVKLGGYFSRHAIFIVDEKAVNAVKQSDDIRSSLRDVFENKKKQMKKDDDEDNSCSQLLRIQTPLVLNWTLELMSSSSNAALFKSDNNNKSKNTNLPKNSFNFTQIREKGWSNVQRFRKDYNFTNNFCMWELKLVDDNEDSTTSSSSTEIINKIPSKLLLPLWTLRDVEINLNDHQKEDSSSSSSSSVSQGNNNNTKNHNHHQLPPFLSFRRIRNNFSQIENDPVLKQVYSCFRYNEKVVRDFYHENLDGGEKKKNRSGGDLFVGFSSHNDRKKLNPLLLHPFSNFAKNSSSEQSSGKKDFLPKQFFQFVTKHKTFQGKPIHISMGQFLEKAVEKRSELLKKEKEEKSEEGDRHHHHQQLSDWSSRVWWPCNSLRFQNKRVKQGADVVQVEMVNNSNNDNNGNDHQQDQDQDHNNGKNFVMSYVNDVDVEDDPNALRTYFEKQERSSDAV